MHLEKSKVGEVGLYFDRGFWEGADAEGGAGGHDDEPRDAAGLPFGVADTGHGSGEFLQAAEYQISVQQQVQLNVAATILIEMDLAI